MIFQRFSKNKQIEKTIIAVSALFPMLVTDSISGCGWKELVSKQVYVFYEGVTNETKDYCSIVCIEYWFYCGL